MKVRLLAAAAATLIAFLLFAGVHSLVTGRSFLHRGPGDELRALAMTDAERMAAAALTEGFFARDPDPAVGLRAKAGFTKELNGVPASTDEHGMRRRVGPLFEAGQKKIVILGDSVAFGWGVGDDETIAHVVQEHLASVGPRPFVTTVASPGWSAFNSNRYIRNHIERYEADLVVLLPFENDLDDTAAVGETGHMEVPHLVLDENGLRPFVGLRPYADLMLSVMRRVDVKSLMRFDDATDIASFSPALYSHTTPFSRARWRTLARGTKTLEDHLAAHDARFVVAWLWYDRFAEMFDHALRTNGIAVPSIPLLEGKLKADELEGDAHPNERAVAAAGLLLARGLIERGFVEGDASRLPPPSAEFGSRAMAAHAPEEANRRIEALLGLIRKNLGPEITRDGVGFHQVYGGITRAWTAGPSAMFSLECRGAAELVIEGEGLAAVKNLTLRVFVAGRDLGEHAFADGAIRIALPDAIRDEPFLDVRVVASDYVAAVEEGVTRLVAWRFLRAALIGR